DGKTLLAVMSMRPLTNVSAAPDVGGGIGIYASTDQGVTWKFRNPVAFDRSNIGRFTYANLLRLPDGQLQSYFLHIVNEGGYPDGLRQAIGMAVSRDDGHTWTKTVPIVGKGADCWTSNPRGGYRTPWAMRLQDGRLLVV